MASPNVIMAIDNYVNLFFFEIVTRMPKKATVFFIEMYFMANPNATRATDNDVSHFSLKLRQQCQISYSFFH